VSNLATPSREDCVLRYVLDRFAAAKPDATFARFEDGSEWSFAETRTRARALATALERLGVGQGDHVVVWLPNGKAALEAYFGVNYIGAVYVPINTAYKGALLAHVIDNASARIVLAHAGLVPRLAEIDLGALEVAVVAGSAATPVPGLELRAWDDVLADAGAAEPVGPKTPIEPWHTQAIIYTSGTTGPSKGVLSSYLHNFASMNDDAWYCVRGDDRYLINMPMFHVGGCFIVYSMLCRGASIAMTEGFRTEDFWRTARQTGSTVVFLLGVMSAFLLKAPRSAGERDHRLKTVFIVPFTEDATRFAERFGVTVYTIFNMTEVSTPIISTPNPSEAGYCGKARPGIELRVVDPDDIELAPGEVGELIVRADQPWVLNHGYYKNAQATAEAWRNGWFHTGDAFRMNEAGEFYYVDRIKDAIRRRGENISSIELETQVNEHPAVQESAAVAVPSEWGEDEVLVVLAPKPGAAIDPGELIAFLAERMAHFMVPRYVRILEALPKTPTTKIQKAPLREDGVTPDTWDREAAGITLKTEQLV